MIYSGENEIIRFNKVLEIKLRVEFTDKEGSVLSKDYWLKDNRENEEVFECLNGIVLEEIYQNEDPCITGDQFSNDRISYINSLQITDFGKMVINSLSAELFERDILKTLIDSTFKELDHEYESFDYEERSMCIKDEAYLYQPSEKEMIRTRLEDELRSFDNADITWQDAFTFISKYGINTLPDVNQTNLCSCSVSIGYVIKVTCEEEDE